MHAFTYIPCLFEPGLEVLQLAVSHWETALDRLEDMEYVVSS